MIDDQNDQKFNCQSTIDNHADIEWKYCFYQKQWSDEVGVVIQFLVVYKSIVYMQLQNCKLLIVFQSLTQSKQTIEIARTRSDRRRWMALIPHNETKLEISIMIGDFTQVVSQITENIKGISLMCYMYPVIQIIQ
ncbi:Hypothetical_protein [Hexamita inflata]|uniref:Hypothetical_protein n=1 Tax=Hexamita inflata TaxID=28002 RepID=A0AA86QSF7_9EUKA|nr:Hypothetical protein HINF_LOCUS48356 [Hexamita inflata]